MEGRRSGYLAGVHPVRRLVTLVAVVLLTASCALGQGTEVSEEQWRSDTELALSSSLSGLRTAELLLEGQDADRFPPAYVRVALRDTLTTVHDESLSYLTGQPPEGRTDDNARVVAALEQTLTVLQRAVVAGSAPTDVPSEGALTALRDQGRRVERLQEELVAS